MSRWLVALVSLFLTVAAGVSSAAAQVTGTFIGGGQTVGGVVVTQNGLPPPRDNQVASGRSTLRGRLTDAGTGAPLRRASVRVIAPELRGARQVTTDNDGRFNVTELPAGRYSVTGSKPGYVDMLYGQAAPLEQTTPITLADRQTLDKIDIALPRGGVITGRVLDEFGEPLVDAQVAPLRMQSAPGGRRPVPTGRSAITNDIGEFRLYGLAPGRYYLSATLQNRTMVMNGQPVEADHTGYAPTFYPAATSFESAQAITVGIGETLSEITVMLQPTLTARISGRVIDAQGQTVTQGFVTAMPIATGGFGMNSGGPITNGQFSINGIAPGEYILRAPVSQPPPGQAVPGQTPQWAIATISVSGSNIDGVTLAPVVPVTLHGRMLLNGAAPATGLRPQTVRVNYVPANLISQMILPPMQPSQTHDDFTFDLAAAPGEIMVRVGGLPPGWLVREVRLSGRDVTDGFLLRSDESGTLEIELTDRAPTVTGTVTNARGETVPTYALIAFSRDSRHWNNPAAGRIGMVRPDGEGKFTLRTLLPGDYFFVAVDHVQNGEWTDPEYLERVSRSATPLQVNEGDSQTLTLRLLEQPR